MRGSIFLGMLTLAISVGPACGAVPVASANMDAERLMLAWYCDDQGDEPLSFITHKPSHVCKVNAAHYHNSDGSIKTGKQLPTLGSLFRIEPPEGEHRKALEHEYSSLKEAWCILEKEAGRALDFCGPNSHVADLAEAKKAKLAAAEVKTSLRKSAATTPALFLEMKDAVRWWCSAEGGGDSSAYRGVDGVCNQFLQKMMARDSLLSTAKQATGGKARPETKTGVLKLEVGVAALFTALLDADNAELHALLGSWCAVEEVADEGLDMCKAWEAYVAAHPALRQEM